MNLSPYVQRFAEIMEAKLRENDRKGGWEECSVDWLYTRLEEEARELYLCKFENAVMGDAAERKRIGREAADVANFAMMIADVCGALLPPLEEPSAEPKG